MNECAGIVTPAYTLNIRIHGRVLREFGHLLASEKEDGILVEKAGFIFFILRVAGILISNNGDTANYFFTFGQFACDFISFDGMPAKPCAAALDQPVRKGIGDRLVNKINRHPQR